MHTAPLIEPIIYAFVKVVPPPTSLSMFGVIISLLPSPAIVSNRWSSVNKNRIFGRLVCLRERPGRAQPARNECAPTEAAVRPIVFRNFLRVCLFIIISFDCDNGGSHVQM
jgi:hypothetical protein